MLQCLVVPACVTGVLGQLNEADFGVMAQHKLSTAIGGGIVDHSDRRPRILTIPNHRWQALLQQVAGVEIQDYDIYCWGWQIGVCFSIGFCEFGFSTGMIFFARNLILLGV